MAVDHVVRQAQRHAAGAHFVFEQHLERLHQLELQVVRQPAHIVVGLDHFSRLGAALHDIRIDGTLGQELDAVQLAGLLFKHADKFGADDFALLLGVGHAVQLAEEPFAGVHIHQVGAQLFLEDLNHLFGLALAQ